MANINLNNYIRKTSDIKSPVDSRIQLNKLQTDNELWGDLRLDLEIKELRERSLNAKESNKDLQRIVNEESVKVALMNIFNTTECSRLLNPEINFDLRSYLFEPLSTYKAWFIGYDIQTILPSYEPRIEVKNVKVTANVNQGYYNIELTIRIPEVNDNVNIKSILSQDGYHVL